MTEMSTQARELSDFMGYLSQEHYSAGWLIDLEYDLWGIVHGENPNYGTATVGAGVAAKLLRLSSACGGWIIYVPAAGRTFVDKDTWLEMYERWRSEER